MSTDFQYASKNEAKIYESVVKNKGKKVINSILLGSYVKILSFEGDWCNVNTLGTKGWMHKDTLSDNMGLKIFYLDVGQGDGVLIEIGKLRILIDAGPDNSMSNYLTKWQYTYLLKANYKVHIDYLIVSHFDTDHYTGFVKILKNKGFTFGTICHAGILKYASKNNPFSSGLGNKIKENGASFLTQIFENLLATDDSIPFNQDVTAFLKELLNANKQGRVKEVKRLKAGDTIIHKKIEDSDFKLEVLAPFTEKVNNTEVFIYWIDDGKTINGHSLVIKLTFGANTFLFGGDLNRESENYLMEKYGSENPFEVDVAKSCHHGSSDFTENFLNQINPYATVISSGDNEGHSHPRADAIGCAGKYSKSNRPLVYSTELARSINLKNNEILFGMINARCNGTDIYISQMKEVKDPADLWDSYLVK